MECWLVYSLNLAAGVLFYALLYGRLPFTSSELPELKEKICKGDFEIPFEPDVSLDARIIIYSLLQVKAERRPSAINLLQTLYMQK